MYIITDVHWTVLVSVAALGKQRSKAGNLTCTENMRDNSSSLLPGISNQGFVVQPQISCSTSLPSHAFCSLPSEQLQADRMKLHGKFLQDMSITHRQKWYVGLIAASCHWASVRCPKGKLENSPTIGEKDTQGDLLLF